jgi:hypothetical protein
MQALTVFVRYPSSPNGLDVSLDNTSTVYTFISYIRVIYKYRRVYVWTVRLFALTVDMDLEENVELKLSVEISTDIAPHYNISAPTSLSYSVGYAVA